MKSKVVGIIRLKGAGAEKYNPDLSLQDKLERLADVLEERLQPWLNIKNFERLGEDGNEVLLEAIGKQCLDISRRIWMMAEIMSGLIYSQKEGAPVDYIYCRTLLMGRRGISENIKDEIIKYDSLSLLLPFEFGYLDDLLKRLRKEEYTYFVDLYGGYIDKDYEPPLETELVIDQLIEMYFYYFYLAAWLHPSITILIDRSNAMLAWASARDILDAVYWADRYNLKIKQDAGREKGRKAQNRHIIEQAIFRIGAEELRSMNKPYSRANKIRKYLEDEGLKSPPTTNTIVAHWEAISKERGWT